MRFMPVARGRKLTKWPQRALLENVIPALGAISRNVSEGPDGLLADVEHGGRKQLDEDGDGA